MQPTFSDLLRKVPQHLFERCVFQRESKTVPQDGRYVLYWLRDAMRWDANPAFDLACFLAHQFRKPLLVVQEIPNSETMTIRQMVFLLGGVSDLHREAEQRGIAYFPFLADSTKSDPMKALATSALAVITDLVPDAASMSRLLDLDRGVAVPFAGVDSNCLVPLTLLPKTLKGWEDFHRITRNLYHERRSRSWPERSEGVLPAPFEPTSLPVTPFVPDAAPMQSWITEASLNHDVLPAVGVRGGRREALRLWAQNRSAVLNAYPDIRAVWCMGGLYAAYLEKGMLSPFDIATDCHLADNVHAETFFREVVMQHDLVRSFTVRNPSYQQYASTPLWVRNELDIHKNDPRPLLYRWRLLTQAMTELPDWNTQQRLFNNVGVLHEQHTLYWGKKIIEWRISGLDAFVVMGRMQQTLALVNPSPWFDFDRLRCFGLLERPQGESRKIVGRLPQAPELRQPITMAVPPVPRWITPKVAVIGAGMAGLACASRLKEQGYDVTVFEKQPEAGGRMRSIPFAGDRLDVGAPFTAPRNPNMRRFAESAVEQGIASLWKMQIAADSPQAGLKMQRQPFVGRQGGMERLLADMVSLVPMRVKNAVSRVELAAGGVRLHHQKDEGEFFDYAILAMPFRQAADVLGEQTRTLFPELQDIDMQSVWVAGVALEKPLPIKNNAFAFSKGACQFAFQVNTQPGKKFRHQTWLLHSFPDWQPLQQKNRTAEESALQQLLGAVPPFHASALPPVVAAHAVEWPQAFVQKPLGKPYLLNRRIALCGDWCLGRRIEDAWNSGRALAAKIILETEFTSRN